MPTLAELLASYTDELGAATLRDIIRSLDFLAGWLDEEHAARNEVELALGHAKKALAELEKRPGQVPDMTPD